MRVFVQQWALAFIFLILPCTQCKVFDRCELYGLFYNNGIVDDEDIANWICLAKASGAYNSSSFVQYGNSVTYGMFRILNEYWCSDDYYPDTNGCELLCSSLIDDTIQDDIDCAKRVFRDHGFEGWTEWTIQCKDKDLGPYIEGCSVPGISYTRCEWFDELKKHEISEIRTLSTMVCLAEHGSGLNGSFVGKDKFESEETFYGIFKLSNLQHCDDGTTSTPSLNLCGTSCDQFLDNNLSDDLECFNYIVDTLGYSEWEEFDLYCDKDYETLIDEYEIKNCLSGKTFDKCELYRELAEGHNIPESDIDPWICIAEQASSLNSAHLEFHPDSTVTNYGLFRIMNTYWCGDMHTVANQCGINCIDLLDDNLADDIACGKLIQSIHGFDGWAEWTNICSQTDLTNYTRECRKEHKIYERCELVTELSYHNVTWEHFADWVCIAEHATGLNSSFYEIPYGSESDRNYGIFRINNRLWCQDELADRNLCRLNCTELLDADISNDIDCALEIFHDVGHFGSWPDWGVSCQGKDLSNYTYGCSVEGEFPSRILSTDLDRTPEFRRDLEGQYLTCKATGYPLPEITWIYDKDQFPDLFSRKPDESNTNITVLNLYFPSADFDEDELIFICEAYSKLNCVEETYKINLVDPPKAFPFAIVLPIVGVVLVAIMAGVVYGLYRKLKVNKGLSKEEIYEFERGVMGSSSDTDSMYYQHRPYDKGFELGPEELEVFSNEPPLGSGQFGIVYKGQVIPKEGSPEMVAVKTVKPTTKDVSFLKDLLMELKALIHIGKHPGIVNLIGAQTSQLAKGQVFIAVEFCALGDLMNFLRNNKPFYRGDSKTGSRPASLIIKFDENKTTNANYFNLNDLMNWALQIAGGMSYLEQKKIIHGDLATRNVLLTAKGDAKISDFGLSRQLYQYTNYVKQNEAPLPWRWMAVESLKSLSFSSKSDVWAYGVALWEMWTLGELPYQGLAWTLEFPEQLERGVRLQKPEGSSDEIFQLMNSCWKLDPSERPNFRSIRDELNTSLYGNRNSTFSESVDGYLLPGESIQWDKLVEEPEPEVEKEYSVV